MGEAFNREQARQVVIRGMLATTSSSDATVERAEWIVDAILALSQPVFNREAIEVAVQAYRDWVYEPPPKGLLTTRIVDAILALPQPEDERYGPPEATAEHWEDRANQAEAAARAFAKELGCIVRRHGYKDTTDLLARFPGFLEEERRRDG